ncbi:FAD-binding oxidoreductase [Frigidibacter sp. RF13]|uniref:FAD-binding oxidoreductase n=1 Tax=Frigidibacter sp. RF13 TaxID=2997340 RepID=UPI002270391D|nr:FAD-binding oxidoreductase [Frigidibacter sp. RF13]MCY1127036.1 FAD-binding oxidoreductase [Frigidibacter sp. RF13]
MRLNPADQAFAARLAALLPEGTVGPVEPRYLTEARGRVTGTGGCLARPRSAGEVSVILGACAAERVGIVPYGGGTGLVLGQVMPEGPAPLILSLERMSRIRAVHATEGVLIAEAGAILADVQEAAQTQGRHFPLALASQGSARIGGLLSTNAGGVNVLRYGNARDLCLGIEAVLPDGSILNGLKRLRKDNTGYDIRNLLIGAEGTLGVITAASLKLFPPAAATGTAIFTVASPAAALALLARAQSRFAGGVTAFELIAGQGLAFLDEVMPDVRQPFATRPDWMVLIETGLPEGLDPAEALGALYAAAEVEGLVSDAVIAQSASQVQDFWRLREALPEANRKIGAVVSHDISLPLSEIPAFLDEGPALIAPFGPFRIHAFGHLGDGNLHFNIFPPKGEKRETYLPLTPAIQRAVHDRVMALGGSFSAEHGVGRLKAADLDRYADPAKLAAMRAIKQALDPHGIMNPGAVLST